jgi:paraquat-inducible protein A
MSKAKTKTAIQLSSRNKLAFALSLISFLFFFPGIYLSMLTVATKGSVNAELPHVEHGFLGIPKVQGTDNEHIALKIFDTSRSTLKIVYDLWERHLYFVSSMIFLFSVIVPLLKESLLTYIFFNRDTNKRKKVFDFIEAIGKWSMCDVFIVAILLTYLSTGASQTENAKNISMMGYQINVDVLTGMHAQLQIGFWCFLIYCLLSLVALQLYEPY